MSLSRYDQAVDNSRKTVGFPKFMAKLQNVNSVCNCSTQSSPNNCWLFQTNQSYRNSDGLESDKIGLDNVHASGEKLGNLVVFGQARPIRHPDSLDNESEENYCSSKGGGGISSTFHRELGSGTSNSDLSKSSS